jgi:hypothetical protein
MSEEFISVHTFRNLEEAGLWQERLKSGDVASIVKNVPADAASGDRFEILVKVIDVEKARKILGQANVHGFLDRPMNIFIYLIGGIIVIVIGFLLIFQSSNLGVGIASVVFGLLLVGLYLYHRIKKKPHKNL